MSWRLTTTAAIVLVLASTMATHAANSEHERDIPEWEQYWAELGKIYRQVKTQRNPLRNRGGTLPVHRRN